MKYRKSNRTNSPTIKDVSQAAGVSTATVSRVLAGFEEVSDETRQRVLNAVQALNYQPNRNARNLRMNTASKVGVVVSDIQNPFFSTVIRGIENILIQDGYTLILGNSDEDPVREQKLTTMLLEEGVAGIILVPTLDDASGYASLFNARIPFVALDRQLPDQDVDMVLVDGFTGAKIAVDYLASLGHQRIGYVGGLKHLSVMQAREEGYFAGLRQHSIPVCQELICQGDNRQDGGHQAVCELLALEDPPSAVLIANNLMTLGGLQAIHESGLDIPGEISLVGFDDMDWASSLRPPLTVVAQPAFEMGEQAASLLLKRIQTPDAPCQQIVLETHLVIRESCRNLRPS